MHSNEVNKAPDESSPPDSFSPADFSEPSKGRASRSLAERLRRYKFFWIIFLVVLLADQASKIYIKEFSGLFLGVYPPYGGWEIIPGFFSIVYNVNTGAAWGMFSGFGLVLAALAVLALAVIYYFRNHLQVAQKSMQLTFGLMTSGIVGNLIDRLAYGFVVDFLDFHLGFYRWPTFNFADSAIFVGVFLYTVISLREDFIKKK